jgi:hypothetical protein
MTMTNDQPPDDKFPPATVNFGRTFDVALSPLQQEAAVRFGERHQELCKRRQQRDQHFDRGRTSDETKIHGMASEFACCLIIEADPEEALFGWQPKGDEGYDIYHWQKRLQVKSTRYRDGKIMMAPGLFRKAFDFVLLIIENPPRYRLVGYLPKATFGRRANYDPKASYKAAISVCQADLFPPEWLEYNCRYGQAWLDWWIAQTKP